MRKGKQLYLWIALAVLSVCLVSMTIHSTFHSYEPDPASANFDAVSDSDNTTSEKDIVTDVDDYPTDADNSNVLEYTLETIESDIILSDDDFVLVSDYIPDITVELKYSTPDNFTGTVIYDFSGAYLRYGTVKKLSEVQKELRSMGMGLKIWDAYRPAASQYKLWEVCPDPTYVADPNKGFSSHSRGNTVDITIVGDNGMELKMPTVFDNFSTRADRDYSDCGQTERQNAEFLESLMKKHGFKPYFGEWWHFTDSTVYEVERIFYPDK